MHRSAFSRRVVVLVVFGGIGTGVSLGVSSAQSNVDDPPPRGFSAREMIANGVFVHRIGVGDYYIPQTGDPEVDAMVRAKAREVLRARTREAQRAMTKAVHEKHLAQMKIWRGTKVMALPGVFPDSIQDVYESVAPNLARAPSPAPRNEMFADFFGDKMEFKCLGWDARVQWIEPSVDGWELMIHVRPQLERERGGSVFTPQVSVETWKLTSQGELQFVKAKKVGYPLVFVD